MKLKYRTTIEIVSEAANKNEALEIVGEYLSGNLVSGIDMRCNTKPANSRDKIILIAVVSSLLLAMGIMSAFYTKDPREIITGGAGLNAVQVPLKTSYQYLKDESPGFRKEWDSRHSKEALEYIKK